MSLDVRHIGVIDLAWSGGTNGTVPRHAHSGRGLDIVITPRGDDQTIKTSAAAVHRAAERTTCLESKSILIIRRASQVCDIPETDVGVDGAGIVAGYVPCAVLRRTE